MKILPSIPEDPRAENESFEQQLSVNTFEEHIKKHDKAKTQQILNLIYSILVGVLSGFLTGKHFRNAKTVGVLVGISSYLISKQASRVSIE